jgi:hypothetical protein
MKSLVQCLAHCNHSISVITIDSIFIKIANQAKRLNKIFSRRRHKALSNTKKEAARRRRVAN